MKGFSKVNCLWHFTSHKIPSNETPPPIKTGDVLKGYRGCSLLNKAFMLFKNPWRVACCIHFSFRPFAVLHQPMTTTGKWRNRSTLYQHKTPFLWNIICFLKTLGCVTNAHNNKNRNNKSNISSSCAYNMHVNEACIIRVREKTTCRQREMRHSSM